ncbi:unnamed protein product [Camellia sinensis]
MEIVRANDASSSDSPCSYDVFLSFRGEDTRKTFTDHLYTALKHAGFRTFRDDDEIERGENIKFELQKAIQESRISIVVFSKDYASSSWWLDELVMILKHMNTTGHVVLPIFYHVNPSHVRKQMGSFKKSFMRHENKFHSEAGERKDDWKGKMQEWRAALREAADLAGMNLQNQADGLDCQLEKLKAIPDYQKILTAFGVNRKRHFEEFLSTSLMSNIGNLFKRRRFGIFSWQKVGITLRNSDKIALEVDAFTRMHKLKLLQLKNLQVNGSFENFPKGLRWLCWHGFSFNSICNDFPLDNLVVLDMQHSNLQKVWEGTKCDNIIEVTGWFKLEPIGNIDVEIMNNLGLPNFGSMGSPTVTLSNRLLENLRKLPLQGCHEEHIFYAYLPESKIPTWFNIKNTGSSISFIVLSLFRIQALSVCSIYALSNNRKCLHHNYDPHTIINNTTKSLIWSHSPNFIGIPEADEDMMWLSYWKFDDQLKGGDEMDISMVGNEDFQVKEVGVHLVYKEQEEKSSQSTSEAATQLQFSLYGNVVPGNASTVHPVSRKVFRLGCHGVDCWILCALLTSGNLKHGRGGIPLYLRFGDGCALRGVNSLEKTVC